MALPSVTMQGLARWLAYYRREGGDPEQAWDAFHRRFPDMPVSTFANANKYAGQMLRVGAAVGRLEPDEPISNALGRLQRPAETVGVSILYYWRDAAGNEYYNTIKVNATWDMSLAEITNAAFTQLEEHTLGRYPGHSLASWEVIPAVLWPYEEGQ